MRAGALLRYKSPSTQLEPVKGCAHPAESAGLGGQPAPQGVGASSGVCICVCLTMRMCLYVLACVLECVYVPVCA